MDQSKMILLLLVALCGGVLVDSHLHPPIKSFQRIVDLSKAIRAVPTLSRQNLGIYYSSCNETANQTVSCKVTQEVPVTDGVVLKKTCSVSVSGNVSSLFPMTLPVNPKTVLLALYKTTEQLKNVTLKVLVINVPSCKAVELSYSNLTSLAQVYPNDDSFDVLYTTDEVTRPDCKSYICRDTYNLNGRKVRGPEQHLRRPEVVSDALFEVWVPLLLGNTRRREPSIHYVGILTNSTPQYLTERLYRVDPRGEATELTRNSDNTTLNIESFSNNNNKVGLCQKAGDKINCIQYDAGARVKLNVSLNAADYSIDTKNVELRTFALPKEEGLLLMTVAVNGTNDKSQIEGLKLIFINPRKGTGLPVEIDVHKENLVCSSPARQYPLANMVQDGPEYCLQLICKDGDLLRYHAKCVPKGHKDA